MILETSPLTLNRKSLMNIYNLKHTCEEGKYCPIHSPATEKLREVRFKIIDACGYSVYRTFRIVDEVDVKVKVIFSKPDLKKPASILKKGPKKGLKKRVNFPSSLSRIIP